MVGHSDVRGHAEATPADEPIVERLVRSVTARRVFPLQAMANHIDDPADHPPVIHTRQPARAREERLNSAHLSTRRQKQVGYTALRPLQNRTPTSRVKGPAPDRDGVQRWT